jgi:arabinose-5-phosphate isomerase
MADILSIAKEVLQTEGKAVLDLIKRLDGSFVEAISLLRDCKGKVVVSGMGKSGHVGRKISATFSSTGTPSIFIHPAEALHGDLGMITEGDVFLSISNSGETDELLRLIPQMRQLSISHITLVGNVEATLARHADVVLDVSVEKEADDLQLAPTASTTAVLAMGDALAVSLMKERNFQHEDFAVYHPGGSLGRRLLTTVGQLMRTENLPLIAAEAPISEVIHQVSSGRLGLAIVMDAEIIQGIITDGDIRRAMERTETAFFSLRANDLMTASPLSIPQETKAAVAEKLMQDKKITSLLVTSNGKLAGVIQIYDLSNIS